MSTSFLALGLAFKWILHYDYKMNKTISWLITCALPLFLFIAGASSFVKAMGISGGIAGGLEGILIVLMFRAAKSKGERKPEYQIKYRPYLAIFLILVYTLGIIYTFYTLF